MLMPMPMPWHSVARDARRQQHLVISHRRCSNSQRRWSSCLFFAVLRSAAVELAVADADGGRGRGQRRLSIPACVL